MAKQKRKPGPPGHGMVSMEPRAVRWRAQKERENAAWRRATGNLMPWDEPLEGNGEGRDVAAIGIWQANAAQESATAEPPTPEYMDTPNYLEDGEDQAYHCLNCTSEIIAGARECPVCELGLDWDGIEL